MIFSNHHVCVPSAMQFVEALEILINPTFAFKRSILQIKCRIIRSSNFGEGRPEMIYGPICRYRRSEDTRKIFQHNASVFVFFLHKNGTEQTSPIPISTGQLLLVRPITLRSKSTSTSRHVLWCDRIFSLWRPSSRVPLCCSLYVVQKISFKFGRKWSFWVLSCSTLCLQNVYNCDLTWLRSGWPLLFERSPALLEKRFANRSMPIGPWKLLPQTLTFAISQVSTLL